MKKIIGDEPVNPIVNSEGYPAHLGTVDPDNRLCTGLTIRQHFAGLAMHGLLAGRPIDGSILPDYSAVAVTCADALIESLNKTP